MAIDFGRALGQGLNLRQGFDQQRQGRKLEDLNRVTQFLEMGVDPNSFDRNRNTALIFAARDGFFKIAQILVDAGAEVNWQDGEEVTPLILASFKNHPSIVGLLLDHGARRDIKDQWERTALTYALRRGADDPIALMLSE